MQVSSPAFSGPRLERPGSSRVLDRACTWLMRFTAANRDRWVSVVCGTGFALLMWVDWLAA